MSVIVRPSHEGDIFAIAEIYGHWVRHAAASFELDPPSPEEMARRRAAILAGGYPYLVAEDGRGTVLGYAYAGPYRTRPAYRFTVEDSIYVSPHAVKLGVGGALLPQVIDLCAVAGHRLMVAVIGDSGNAGSIALHRRFGFTPAGVLPAAGWKHGRWVDSVLMTRPLGVGATTAPD